jgi:hypothetical protein
MDSKIHIYSNTNCIGKSVYFVYKTGEKEGYCCASLEWSPYLIDKYRVFKYVNDKSEFLGLYTKIPYDVIENNIKEIIKNKSNIIVDNIKYCHENKLKNFIKYTEEYVHD